MIFESKYTNDDTDEDIGKPSSVSKVKLDAE